MNKEEYIVTVNCPVSELFPQAGINRPCFSWNSLDTSSYAQIVDNKIEFIVPTNVQVSQDDICALNIIKDIKLNKKESNYTLVENNTPYKKCIHITSNQSNGPISFADFNNAKTDLNDWTIEKIDNITKYIYQF